MKVLIVKGALGFGDRLESLKMCVHYALYTNRAIYVDWTDKTWSHGGESFYKYFDLVGLNSLKSLDSIPEDATVFPPAWKGKLNEQILDVRKDSNLETNIHEYKLYDEDVVVHACLGYRKLYPNSQFFAECFRVIDPRIINKVKSRQSRYDLKSKVGIHLRGTDRASSVDYKAKRISELSVRIVMNGWLSSKKMIAVSDDPEYIKFWNGRFPEHPVLTEKGNLGGRAGAHNEAVIPVSKDELNVDLLVDFFTLSSCEKIVSTSPDSRFTHEATRLHPHVDLILSQNGRSV
jgi:hypothetical protein